MHTKQTIITLTIEGGLRDLDIVDEDKESFQKNLSDQVRIKLSELLLERNQGLVTQIETKKKRRKNFSEEFSHTIERIEMSL